MCITAVGNQIKTEEVRIIQKSIKRMVLDLPESMKERRGGILSDAIVESLTRLYNRWMVSLESEAIATLERKSALRYAYEAHSLWLRLVEGRGQVQEEKERYLPQINLMKGLGSIESVQEEKRKYLSQIVQKLRLDEERLRMMRKETLPSFHFPHSSEAP